jgi:ABC-type Na+ efflux pump permease subunit
MIVKPLASMAWRSTLRSRRFLFALLVSAIPLLLGGALIAVDAENAAHGSSFGGKLGESLAYLVLAGTIPFVAILLAGSLVADEVEDRTFSYLLVRPIKRHQIYLSRLLPMAVIAVLLAFLQVLGYSALRFVSWMMHGQGTMVLPAGGAVRVPVEQVMLTEMGRALAAGGLAAVAFLCLFAFVTVLTTRYHFLANVLWFLSFETLFGNLGGRGMGFLTVTFHARSLLLGESNHSGYSAASWYVAVPMLLVFIAFWTWIGAVRMGRRDFNVTSAAS